MPYLPRVAIGAIQQQYDPQPVVWALLDVLERQGMHVQAFLSQSRFLALDAAAAITGQRLRHLDSWSMTPPVCRELFWHGARSADLAVVLGRFCERYCCRRNCGGSLDALCHWLDLPRIVVLDATRVMGCRLPAWPGNVDGVILDRVPVHADLAGLETNIEAYWGAPVLASLSNLPPLRAIASRLPQGACPSRRLCRLLGRRLEESLDLDRLMDAARLRSFPEVSTDLFSGGRRGSLVVAVAYDEAFPSHFPETLDLLQSHGATVCDFSPLRDATLPADADLIYLGSGQPEQHAESLAGNHCMMQAIRDHARAGKRVYAEGGGLAYASQFMTLRDGRQLPMIGLLPTVARQNPLPAPLEPQEVQLRRSSWLGDEASRLRGYFCSNWLVEPLGRVDRYGAQWELIGRGPVIGSQLLLNFASQPRLLNRLFQPSLAPATSPAAQP